MESAETYGNSNNAAQTEEEETFPTPRVEEREPHELDCPLCRSVLYEPITTPCGHNFCKPCLLRALDYSPKCPICRESLYMMPSHPINSLLKTLARHTFPQEYLARLKEDTNRKRDLHFNLPLFVLDAVLFPEMPMTIHVFEYRYQVMLERCLQGSRCFGIIAPQKTVGTLARIDRCFRLPDGRSVLHLVGSYRFHVVERWIEAEGYHAAKILPLEDEEDKQQTKEEIKELRESTSGEPNEQDTATEQGELQALRKRGSTGATSTAPEEQEHETTETVFAQITRELEHKLRIHDRRLLEELHGPIPFNNPQKLSYWLACSLPLSIENKQSLLEIHSTKERLMLERQYLASIETLAPAHPPTRKYLPYILGILFLLLLWIKK
ncbi:LON peptidase N-terminal domain and RING finger protein 3 [Balamuthia mandrillaris]